MSKKPKRRDPLRWLHISDFHTGKDPFGQQQLFKYLLIEIQTRVTQQLRPDFIFITLMSQKEPYVAPEYLTNSFSGYLNARLSPVGLRPRKTNGKMITVQIPHRPHQQTEKGL